MDEPAQYLEENIDAAAPQPLAEATSYYPGVLAGAINALATTIQLRDPYTSEHQKRVAAISTLIAHYLGLSQDQIEGIYVAGRLHDIGKIKIPSEVLNKPGALREYEFELIKTHSGFSEQILGCIDFPWPVAKMARQHHERLDGSGYPDGIEGNQIGIGAKIIAVADVLEAMVSHRPYRPALGLESALDELTSKAGTLYDQQVVAMCISLYEAKKLCINQKGRILVGKCSNILRIV
jgi:HD-GYP domain-containing protein (c-di-GMP phosphodiesterase class II)